MIKKFTVTGADDKTDQQKLVELTRLYPFVEWGILLSKSNLGKEKYPSLEWIESFKLKQLPSSGHLCGTWRREMNDGLVQKELLKGFGRIQLNGAYDKEETISSKLIDILSNDEREIIFQLKNVNCPVCHFAKSREVKAVPLFDQSGGKGVLPKKWPTVLGYSWAGYAGGLTPDNLKEEIRKILSSLYDCDIWLDIETGVRTDNQFDLEKVEKCLKIIKEAVDGSQGRQTRRAEEEKAN